MENKKVLGKIILYELSGFLAIILLVWLNELVDIPHYLFGAPATPVNVVEGLIETVAFLACGAVVIYQSRRLIRQIRYLEGFLHVCAFCRKINVEDDWIPLESYLKQRSEVQISHSFCPECYEEHFRKYE